MSQGETREQRNGLSRPEIFSYVETAIEERLSEFDAWPANLFKLELESAGVYQNFSGACMLELLERGEVGREYANDYPYMVSPGADPPDSQSIVRQKTETVYALTGQEERGNEEREKEPPEKKGSFAELALYTALCRERKQLSDEVPLEIYPNSEYPFHRHGNADAIDAMITLNQEIFPIEVYNGRNLVDGEHKKYRQIQKNSVDGSPPNNPVLVSRIAAEEVREDVRENNGSVIDTGIMLACEETNPGLADALEFLNLQDRVTIIPKIETSEGHCLDGKKYDQWTTSEPERILSGKLEDSADVLPEEYKEVVRGGLHLLYVNSFYRHADDVIGREASIVLQNGFHHLLRSSTGLTADRIIDSGWGRLEDHYQNIAKARPREDAIRSKAQKYVSTLLEQNVITRGPNGLYARGSIHPHASLQFPKGYHRSM